MMNKKVMLLPLLLLDRYDLYMENGQAAPKQTSIMISNTLIMIYKDANNYIYMRHGLSILKHDYQVR
jgi:hypothetical protein